MSEKKQLSTREVQLKMLDIMKDIDRFCRANDIPYSLACGTLLGAVRHGGFIPWDDDADLFMLREDFDRFVKIYKSDKYQVSYILDKEDGYFGLCLAKVLDPNVSTDKDGRLKHAGIFVDIFPMDGVSEDPKESRKRMHRIAQLENRIYHRRRTDLISILKSYRHSLKWWIEKFDKIVHDKSYYDSKIVAHAVGSRKYEVVMPRSEFSNLKNIKFEGYDFLTVPDTHHYLVTEYGEDYMTPKKWNHNITVYEQE